VSLWLKDERGGGAGRREAKEEEEKEEEEEDFKRVGFFKLGFSSGRCWHSRNSGALRDVPKRLLAACPAWVGVTDSLGDGLYVFHKVSKMKEEEV
jgi:hypothetical protein